MFYDWPEDSNPADSAHVIDMIKQMERTQQMTGNGSMAVHCRLGFRLTPMTWSPLLKISIDLLAVLRKESQSNDNLLHFVEFSNVHNSDRSSNPTRSNVVYKTV